MEMDIHRTFLMIWLKEKNFEIFWFQCSMHNTYSKTVNDGIAVGFNDVGVFRFSHELRQECLYFRM